MKIITAVFLGLLFIVNAQAQDQLKKGVYSLSGALAFTSSNSHYNFGELADNGNDMDQLSISIFPKASLFFFDRVEGSLGLGYYHAWGNSSSTVSHSTELELSLGFRYYFPLDKIAPFIGADGFENWISIGGSNYSRPTSDYRFIGGMEIFISRNAAIEPAIIYSKYSNDYASGREFSISLGIKYFIL